MDTIEVLGQKQADALSKDQLCVAVLGRGRLCRTQAEAQAEALLREQLHPAALSKEQLCLALFGTDDEETIFREHGVYPDRLLELTEHGFLVDSKYGPIGDEVKTASKQLPDFIFRLSWTYSNAGLQGDFVCKNGEILADIEEPLFDEPRPVDLNGLAVDDCIFD